MKTYIYNQFIRLPKTLLTFIMLNCLYGFIILYSAGQNELYPWAFKQIVNFAIFVPVMFFVAFFNIRTLYNYSYSFFLFVLGLLVAVELFGHTAMGATRWLDIGGIRIQPSELAKIAMVFFLAKYFHNIKYDKIPNLLYLLPAIIGVLILAVLIIKQPDLGTGMIVIIISAILFYVAGVRSWMFIAGLLGTIGVSPIIWYKLHDYQKKRIEVFLNPDKDPLNSGYNIIQSKIAIGSGGFFGRGLGQGTQSHLSFLPEHQTDFIFACLCEDLGFLGAMVLFAIYAMIIWISLSIAINAKSLYGKFLAIGITSIFFCHIFINIGMVTGLLPVVGIPLPLISYGGTMMGSILIGFGIIMNVHINQSTKI